MAEKVQKVSVLLQALSRIPGLGFLSDADRQLRSAHDAVDNVNDQIDDGQRQVEDIRTATGEIGRNDD